MPPPPPAVWSREEEKALESAVASLPPPTDGIDAWLGEVALRVPGKTLAEVRRHYGLLVEDVRAIEAGDVPLPNYKDDLVNDHDHGQSSNAHHRSPEQSDRKSHGSALSKSEQDRRKGTPWTEEEHKLFLLGLSKFGKGDWRSISRNFVVSRTPTQVASHAQKYFIRLNSMNRDRRRSSIHDITSIHGGDPSAVGSPRTGAPIVATGPPPTVVGTKLHPPPLQQGMPVYGPPPVTGHAMPAMGTPVMLPRGHPPPPHPYAVPMAYPVGPPPTVMRQ